MNIQNKLSLLDWIMEVLALAALILVIRPLFYLQDLGDTLIPIHYNISGQADGWGASYHLWVLAAITLFLYILLSIVGRYYPHKINYPFEIASEDAPRAYKYGVRTMMFLKFFLTSIFAYIANASVAIAMGDATSLNHLVMVFLVCGMLATLIVFVIKLWRL